MFLTENGKKMKKQGKEAIHSGHFMVSHFEAEAQDDDEIAVPIPDIPLKDPFEKATKPILFSSKFESPVDIKRFQPIGIETSLSKLFQCMSIAYRQKLTSPKWNRFRGIRLRWKDKIRLNNVIWRCWHMQFIKRQNTLICQFASPLDVDTHNKPEAIVMEGKYWKRKLEAVTAEYKKWRMFYKNQSFGCLKDANDLLEMELMKCELSNSESDAMLMDEDYMGLMSDTLFSTITNHPFAFPDTREIAKAGLADFIQPSLGPLQPNLPNNDFMDTIEHFDLLSGKLPTVPEEHGNDAIYSKAIGWDYPDITNTGSTIQLNTSNMMDQYQQLLISMNSVPIQNNRQTTMQYDNEVMMQPSVDQYINRQTQPYQTPVISKSSKQIKDLSTGQVKVNTVPLGSSVFNKSSIETAYSSFSISNVNTNVTDPLRIDDEDDFKILQNTESNQQSSQNFRITPQVSSTKYTSPMAENYKLPPRLHVSSHGSPMISNQHVKPQLKEDKSNNKTRNSNRGRRSRSNTREPLKRPPLQTAVSDPSLITPVNSMILSQLLTNDTDSVYTRRTQSVSSTHDSNIRCKEETPQPLCIVPHSSLHSGPVIISPVNINSVQKTESLLSNTLPPTSPHVETGSQSLSSPTSPQGSIESPSREPAQKEQRRSHIHAEQKRRYNIKNGFDMIHSLIPHLNQNPNAKLSKAAMLQKGAEYIMQLRTERDQLKDEMDSLRHQIESLNTSIRY